jgi:hypothetical protein
MRSAIFAAPAFALHEAKVRAMRPPWWGSSLQFRRWCGKPARRWFDQSGNVRLHGFGDVLTAARYPRPFNRRCQPSIEHTEGGAWVSDRHVISIRAAITRARTSGVCLSSALRTSGLMYESAFGAGGLVLA